MLVVQILLCGKREPISPVKSSPCVLMTRWRKEPGPDSRNDPLAISSDMILWSWSADRIPQALITIGSSDRENTKPNCLWPIESWHKSFTGKFRTEITWSWLKKNVRLMVSIHDVTMGGVAMSFMSADTKASWPVQCTHTVFAHDTTRFGHAIFDRYLYVINAIENIHCWHKADYVPVNVSQ